MKWLGKANRILETILTENCLIFRISWLSWGDMHPNILKLWENGEEFWNGVFCMLLPGVLLRWCMNPPSLNYTLRIKKCTYPTFSRGEFLLFHTYSNFWVLRQNLEQFWNVFFFAYCYQEHSRNEIHTKILLATLFPKRNTTVHGAFLLRLSVCTIMYVHII